MTSFEPGAMDAATNKRQLDITINQRLNAQFTDRDQGGGSATVLLYPGENEDDEANSTNATCDAPEPPPKFAGTARSLKD